MPSHIFHVERLSSQASCGWVPTGMIESDKGSYAAMDEWFAANDPEPGRYRLVEFTSYGGNFIEFEVKQKLILEEVKRLAEVA
jgi:hypothetical protein